MKFRFCWDTDCPDWLLAEIATMSTMSALKLRLLVGHIAGTISGQQVLDPAKVAKWSGAEEGSQAAAACVGGISWILEKAAGAQVSSTILDSELQQLGLPKEHATAITKMYTDNQDAMYNKLRESSGINCYGGDVSFQVDVKGLEVAGEVEPIAQLTMVNSKSTEEMQQPLTKLCLTSDQLKVLIQELCDARQIMASLR